MYIGLFAYTDRRLKSRTFLVSNDVTVRTTLGDMRPRFRHVLSNCATICLSHPFSSTVGTAALFNESSHTSEVIVKDYPSVCCLLFSGSNYITVQRIGSSLLIRKLLIRIQSSFRY